MPTGQNTGSRGGRGAYPPLSGQNQFDGPAEERGRSQSASRASQRGQSASRAQAGPVAVTRSQPILRNVDFGGQAYASQNGMDLSLKSRGTFGKAGRPVKIAINSHTVLSCPDKTIYQYDVVVGSGQEKRALIKKVWASKKVKEAVGPAFIFDGNRLGWSLANLRDGLRITVDMDEEQGRRPRKTKSGEIRPDIVPVVVKHAKTVNLATIFAYLDKKGDFTEELIQSVNFLDHLLRETPSKNLVNLRRSYFVPTPPKPSAQQAELGGGVEALKGVYQSLRMAEGKKLVINADVSNAVFWIQMPFDLLCMHMASAGPDRIESVARWYSHEPKQPKSWDIFKRLKGSVMYIKHKGIGDKTLEKKALNIIPKSAETYKFDWTNRATGTTKNISVRDYFKEKYNITLNKPYLPLVEVKRGEVYPMEVCLMAPGQQYKVKLNEDQTSKMIKFAATRPQIRREGIQYGLSKLKWAEDPFLKNYGLKIDPNMLQTNARVLEPPEVLFANKGSAKPMFSGRWDLKGKVFIAKNPVELKSWGVVVLTGSDGGDKRAVPNDDEVNAFVQNFLKIYKGHGGIVKNNKPLITRGIADTALACETGFKKAGDQAQFRPQMMMVILTNKNSDVYHRVKANMDCRFGIMSQCVQANNIKKNAPQYCSNVLMKFNLKLGGTTSNVRPTKGPYYTEPTMIIGADVSHAPGGMTSPSLSAITISMDRQCARFAATVQVNGYRQELIEQRNFIEGLGPLISRWMTHVGGGRMPKHVYYFRDGVSESQYLALIQKELADIMKAFEIAADGKKELMPKFTTVVCEKRHHIRFFPGQGPASDKNGNPVPGVIVDRDVTHPFEEDFYLNSHSAIQGTARPTHYHMLQDEYGVNVDTFQRMVYEHCYQYQRATTPVSLFPAVYYAHLAAARAHAHIDKSAQASWVEKHLNRENPGQLLPNFQGNVTFPPDLKTMHQANHIEYGMWYI